MGVFTISAFTNEQTLLSAQVESPQQYYDFSSVSKHLRHRLDRIISLSDEHASDLLWIGEGVSHVIWRGEQVSIPGGAYPSKTVAR